VKLSLSNYVMFAPAAALVLVGVASVAFAVGANSGPTSAPGAMPALAHASRAPLSSGAPANPRGGFFAPAPVTGTVASKTASTIVVTTVAGKSVTVDVSPTTTYLVRGVANASLADIAVGNRIAAQGTFNADGSLSATRIQGGTAGGRGGFGGGRGDDGGGIGVPSPIPSGPST
jgi:uncharacterized membrane protein YgcG